MTKSTAVVLAFAGLKALNRDINTVIKMGAKYDPLVHNTALQAMLHCKENGQDARPLDRLLNGLGKVVRRKAFQAWVQMYTPVRWNGDGQIGLQKATAKGYTDWNIEGAAANPFWDATEEKVVVRKLSLEDFNKVMHGYAKMLEGVDAEGNIYNSKGELKATVEGNVIELKAYIAKKLGKSTPAAIKAVSSTAARQAAAVAAPAKAKADPLKSTTKKAAVG